MRRISEDGAEWHCETCGRMVSFRGPNGEPEHTEDETDVCEIPYAQRSVSEGDVSVYRHWGDGEPL
jgi:hypothetical protein